MRASVDNADVQRHYDQYLDQLKTLDVPDVQQPLRQVAHRPSMGVSERLSRNDSSIESGQLDLSSAIQYENA